MKQLKLDECLNISEPGVLLQGLFIIEGKVLTSDVHFMNAIIHRLESGSHSHSVGLVITSDISVRARSSEKQGGRRQWFCKDGHG